jgi:hypothetical protein
MWTLIAVQAPTRSGPKEAAKRRGRPPGKRNEITARKGGPTEHSLTATKKRGATSAAAKGKEKQKKQGEKRKSQAEDNESSSHPKPRGRPPKDRTEAPVATQEKGKKRKSQAGENNRPSKQAKQQGRPPKDRNQEPVEDPDELAAEQPKTQTYVQLVPRTRRIPQEKIDTWPQVSAQVLEEIVAVLRDAKKDIVNTARDDRRELADERLGALVRTLEHQLADSRIPPQARDIHFDIDKLTERTAQVFREVTTQRHSKQLLTDQVKVAERLLAKDEENLEQLKKNTAKWRAAWKRQEQRGQVGSSLFLIGLSVRLTYCSSIHCCRAWIMAIPQMMALTTLA